MPPVNRCPEWNLSRFTFFSFKYCCQHFANTLC